MKGRCLIVFVLFVSSIVSSSEDQTLAPHPVYFAPMGEPTRIQIDIEGVLYDVNWDGASLDLEYGNPPAYGEPPINEGPPPTEEPPDDGDPLYWYGVLFIVGGSIILTAIWVWILVTFF